jgi:hypothetical protein
VGQDHLAHRQAAERDVDRWQAQEVLQKEVQPHGDIGVVKRHPAAEREKSIQVLEMEMRMSARDSKNRHE